VPSDRPSDRRWLAVTNCALAGLALLLRLPDACRAVWLGPTRKTYSPLFVLLVPFFVERASFYLLPTKAKKTNKKPKDYIIKRTKN